MTNSPVVFHKSPKLFKSIKLTTFEVFQSFCLEVSIEVWSELLFQSITEESEEALKTVSEQEAKFSQNKPKVSFGINRIP